MSSKIMNSKLQVSSTSPSSHGQSLRPPPAQRATGDGAPQRRNDDAARAPRGRGRAQVGQQQVGHGAMATEPR